MSYAARHPDMFAVAASFSGAPEIDRDPSVIPFSTAIVEAIAVGLDGVPYGSMFGDRLSHEINWRGHDPASLLNNLRGMGLYMWTATGFPGPLDTNVDLAASGIEAITHVSTQLFHSHLNQARIPNHYTDYVLGTHTFPYWARDLHAVHRPADGRVRAPAARRPRSTTSRSTPRGRSGAGRWRTTAPQTQAFSSLSSATAAGFALRGLGSATVTTPACTRPARRTSSRSPASTRPVMRTRPVTS